MRLKLSDMTPELRARVEKAMNGSHKTVTGHTVTPEPYAGEKPITLKGQNKTEAEYNRVYLHGLGLYEAITLRLPGGSRYTPDFVTFFANHDEAQVTLHEVKHGSYRHASQGRALTAFRECVAAFPCFRFVWAVREKDGWKVKEYGGVE